MTAIEVSDTVEATVEAASRHFAAGRLESAEDACRRILRREPESPAALHLLGQITYRAGNPMIAAAFIRKAIAADPDVPTYHYTLGRTLKAQGSYVEATTSFRRAVELDPSSKEAHLKLGAVLHEQGDYEGAIISFERALELDPRYPAAHLSLGIALQQRFQHEASEACFRRVLELDPTDPNGLVHLGGSLLNQGRLDEAIIQLRQAAALRPDAAEIHSNLFFVLHYLPSCTRETLVDEARAWGQRFAQSLCSQVDPHVNERDPERRLRIGYVSADFHRHPVGYFLEAVLRAHDKEQVEIYCYSNHRGTDYLTERLHAASDHWRVLVGIKDDLVVEAIRRDAIDILVDLSGHTAGHRLGIFARKPAPVQVTWIGYFGTTGLPAIDYILLDRFLCPDGDESFYTEQVVRLPETYLCYAPQSTIDVSPLPALARGYITFGCFNKAAKVNPTVIALWGEILRSLPDARLCLKDTAFEDASVRTRYRQLLAQQGVSAERLMLLGRTPYEEHLAAYGEIDVALDPFPFNGGTTTVEALWMGVPVVTLAGDHFVSRMGVSHLSGVGLTELIALSSDDYTRIALGLARDLPRLAALRASLRERMLASPLCDAPRFTRGLEAAYRQIWRNWCRS